MKFIARQPILSRERSVYAYELLFRSGIENSCEGINLDQASASLFDTSFLIGLHRLTEGRRAFVNCPRDFLLRDYISLFPPDLVVVELLETMEPDEKVVEACRHLKNAGYMLALDDFVDTPDWAPLIAMADFIKVDFRLTGREEQRSLVVRHAAKGIRMLAEKVETPEEFSEAVEMGYTLFQGYFFCRPEMVQQRTVPAFKLAYLELLQSTMTPEIDIGELATKIKHEPSLTFKLLRYLNSAAFGLRSDVHSVRHALSLLGERELRKWIAVVSVGVLADGKPEELMTVPLVRGRFCEQAAALTGLGDHASDLFLMGLLSVMDAILDQPLDLVLADMPVRREIKEALLSNSGLYRNILALAIAIEKADWETVSAMSSALRMKEAQVSALYFAAVDWSAALKSGVRHQTTIWAS